MNPKLYVGNLSSSTTEDMLSNLFAQSGTVVSVDLIKDRLTHQSKGYAFIIMSTAFQAEKAIEMFNGLNVDGSEIRVSFARRRETHGGFSDGDKGQSRPAKRGRTK